MIKFSFGTMVTCNEDCTTVQLQNTEDDHAFLKYIVYEFLPYTCICGEDT